MLHQSGKRKMAESGEEWPLRDRHTRTDPLCEGKPFQKYSNKRFRRTLYNYMVGVAAFSPFFFTFSASISFCPPSTVISLRLGNALNIIKYIPLTMKRPVMNDVVSQQLSFYLFTSQTQDIEWIILSIKFTTAVPYPPSPISRFIFCCRVDQNAFETRIYYRYLCELFFVRPFIIDFLQW